MRRILSLLLAIMMILSLSACSEKQPEQITGNEQPQSTKESVDSEIDNGKVPTTDTSASTTESDSEIDNGKMPTVETSANTIEELEIAIAKDVEDTVNALNNEWQALSATINSYDDYVKNAEKVEAFYDKINYEAEQVFIRLQQYAVKYAELIMSSDISNDDKYDAFDDLNDCIYDDAADDLNDDIYDGLLDDMQDALYYDILDDSDDADDYSEWYDVRSDEYENWYDTRSDVYENWYDTRSDVYDFCYDMRGELWSDDIEKAEKALADYKEDVEKLTR